MNYYIDSEFQEGFHKPRFGKRRHFIDLISIAIVGEDGKIYYAISNEFDIKKVWKDEWLRENVLKQLHKDLSKKENTYSKTYFYNLFEDFTLKSLKNLIKWHGKSNEVIAREIIQFTENDKTVRRFYGYYCDYDWVLLCSLFGKMLDLPENYPMYCRDLKQLSDEISERVNSDFNVSEDSGYPIQDEGEHSALEDALWMQTLHNFLIDFDLKSKIEQLRKKIGI